MSLTRLGHYFLERPGFVIGLVLSALIALPVAVWLDMRNLSDRTLQVQAESLGRVITAVRSYYATSVVNRIAGHDGPTSILASYRDVDGAIPLPATLSIELAEIIGAIDGEVAYRFVSDYPFANRAPHEMDAFEREALVVFRGSRDPNDQLIRASGGMLDRELRYAVPVMMGPACVACHNTHPDSPRTLWQVGDVRGIQSVSVQQPVALSFWSFRWLFGYLVVAGGVGFIFAGLQFRIARSFHRLNDELEQNNSFLADVSLKVSRYISPQIYRSIFAGERDTTISTERKKLTIFFSDIKDFTSTTERLQPETLTALLNEYFTEMSKIAEDHGATIDKFIGDAIVAFFGDPTTKGDVEDARTCVKMAMAMQARLAVLNAEWSARGIEHPFRARIGLNTGYCNVGNFGSETRMDYTIIGAEANLAARLEGIAEPGGIVMSYETWAHAKDLVEAKRLAPQHFKGIAREVTPYQVVMPDRPGG